MTISISTSGSFRNTQRFLENIGKMDIRSTLNKYGEKGVRALKSQMTELLAAISPDQTN